MLSALENQRWPLSDLSSVLTLALLGVVRIQGSLLGWEGIELRVGSSALIDMGVLWVMPISCGWRSTHSQSLAHHGSAGCSGR